MGKKNLGTLKKKKDREGPFLKGKRAGEESLLMPEKKREKIFWETTDRNRKNGSIKGTTRRVRRKKARWEL